MYITGDSSGCSSPDGVKPRGAHTPAPRRLAQNRPIPAPSADARSRRRTSWRTGIAHVPVRSGRAFRNGCGHNFGTDDPGRSALATPRRQRPPRVAPGRQHVNHQASTGAHDASHADSRVVLASPATETVCPVPQPARREGLAPAVRSRRQPARPPLRHSLHAGILVRHAPQSAARGSGPPAPFRAADTHLKSLRRSALCPSWPMIRATRLRLTEAEQERVRDAYRLTRG
jgi:hypothetical protein